MLYSCLHDTETKGTVTTFTTVNFAPCLYPEEKQLKPLASVVLVSLLW